VTCGGPLYRSTELNRAQDFMCLYSSAAYEASIGVATVNNILKKHSFNSVKPTGKCGLTQKQKDARYSFALAY
jgi:Transposase